MSSGFFETVTIEKLPLSGAFQNIEISVIALLFNLLLIMIVESQSLRSEQKAGALVRVLFAILCANFVTCLYVFLAYADLGVPNTAICILQSAALMSNTAVCYLFSAHVLQFVNRSLGEARRMPVVNRLLLLLEGALLLGWLFFALPRIGETGVLIRPVGWFYNLVAFVIEVWFLLYAMWLIASRRNLLTTRANLTVVVTFLLTIVTVILQAFIGRAPVINYLGATFGMFVFYFNAETPDYLALTRTLSELEEAKKRSDDASKAKSTFLANMSHEIRTPLSAVLAMNQMIIREETDETIRSYARSAERAGQNLLSVINDILDFSRIESGRMEVVSEPYRLSEVLRDVCGMISLRASEKELSFRTEIAPDTPDALLGDALRLRQMITNLLNNSVKYTKEGEVVLSVSAKTADESKAPEQVQLVIRVSDTGIGISKEDLPRLFDKFERFDMRKNNTIEGTGLGLAIVKELCERMGGRIEAESAYGEGSTFSVFLPQERRDGSVIGAFDAERLREQAAAAPYQASFYAPDARLLVVDDTDVNLTVFQKLLKQTGVQVDAVMSGLEAIAKTQDAPYDVIFLDQRMPGMDGVETLSFIRNQEGGVNKKTPVVCLTADALQGARERYLSYGFTDYLSKPIEWEKLEQTVVHYLPDEKVLPPEAAPERAEETKKEEQNDQEKPAPDEKALRRFYDASGILSFRNAIQNCMDAETLYEVLTDYYRGIPDNMRQIREASGAGDLETYRVKVHSLKSASRVIGALDFAEEAYRLEQMADAGALDEIRSKTPGVLALYGELERILGELLSGEGSDGKTG